ncbi:hypothetical protein MKW94_000234 [Papaver nudicaule]|uniref:Trichome birefringence-like N-terminal domain-containing protein n=1 Tax=Papaver nudicaule TaxID=74823 RepID=A0AA41VNI1_PAPNU|nr:hypothetical protein [Papaver nudicaule]
MAKGIRLDWKPWSVFKQSHFLVRFAVSVLVICLGLHIIYSNTTTTDDNIPSIGFYKLRSLPIDIDSIGFLPAPCAQKAIDDTMSPAPAPSEDSAKLQRNRIQNQITRKEKCDLSIGEWILDPSRPMYYQNGSCPFLPDDQNCIKNGRLDSGFLYWRWKPRDCELPRFNAVRFLDSMQNKHWAIVGDSISRNHAQSLLCILSEVCSALSAAGLISDSGSHWLCNETDFCYASDQVAPANEVYHDEGFTIQRWHFEAYNFSLSTVWSPFLVEYVPQDTNDFRLDLDKLDKKWADQYTSFDYMVISAGRWFLRAATYYENNTIVGCHYCPGKNLTEYGLDNGYRKALKLVFDFVQNSNHSSLVLYRTTTPVHKGHGNTGGTCDRSEPYKQGEIDLNDEEVVFRNVELEAFKDGEGKSLKLLNVSEVSLLRPDGHPGPYWHYHLLANATYQNDCLHWCLPGPIDNWNDLIMEMVLND